VENDRNNSEKETEIDLGEIFRELLRKIWIIILITGIAAVLTLIVSMFFIKPTYESSTKVFILSRTDSTSSAVTYSDLQTSTQLTSDYEQLVKSRYVMENTISALNLDMTTDELSGDITVSSPTGTRILQITVKSDDPLLAQQIANKVREIAADRIVSIMNIDAVNLVDEANYPMTQSSPNVKKNAAIGAVIGFILSCAVIIIMYMTNDLIKTPDDIEKYLGLSILGEIPDATMEKKRKKRA
jgi:capsular polysaccharide biosynthesis protein